jgi:glycosyltransferase involved in cell wall biosynthesis
MTPELPDLAPWRYDVVGLLKSDYGLSIAARNSSLALRSSGRIVREVAVELPADAREAEIAKASRPDPQGRLTVNLFHLNPLDIACRRSQWQFAIDVGANNVCVPFWELPVLPEAWVPALSAMQAVLAPSRFIESACTAVLPKKRVVHYPQAVFLPSDVRPDREAWGLAKNATVFIVAFDIGSDIERKNPWASIEAFYRAFPTDPGAQLVIKMKPWPGVPEFRNQADALRRRIALDARVRLIEESLPYDRVMQLYASCDVMLSLHRSEGLGLHLMEAMALGKVVVATNWSGNVDYMSPDDSELIGYRLVPVVTGHPSYASELGRTGQVWADADIDEAATTLRALHGDPARRMSLGRAAAAEMTRRKEAMLAGSAFDALEARLANATEPRPDLSPALRRSLRLAERRLPIRSRLSLALARGGAFVRERLGLRRAR